MTRILPNGVLDYLSYYKRWIEYSMEHRKVIKDIRKQQKVRVAFIVMNVSMWKNMCLYELLQKDERFEVRIILSPSIMYDRLQQKKDLEQMKTYFSTKGVSYVDYDFNSPYDLRKEFNPHLIFYPQTYVRAHCTQHDYTSFTDRLIVYVPYSFWPTNEKHGFDLSFHRHAWRIYYANEMIYDFAKSISLNKARNARITGYPSADYLLASTQNNPWKSSKSGVKKIIWAPHFTIKKREMFSPSTFLDICDKMVSLAQNNVGVFQFAFKPHPRLRTELYRHPDWGVIKTEEYYNLWANMPNTQVESGDYYDLFSTSDLLIHDSGSFMIEYLYTHKPCIYVSNDFSRIYNELNPLGTKALDLHYKASDWTEISSLIDSIIIKGDDPIASEREEFFKSQLLPPNGRTVAENIYNDLVQSLLRS